MEYKNNTDAGVSSLEDISNSTLETIKLCNFSTDGFLVRFFCGFGEGLASFFCFLHMSSSLAIESEKHVKMPFSF